MMNHIMSCENAIPIPMSRRIVLMSDLVIFGVPSPMSLILCFSKSSSASSDVCQKKRYGEIVVPNKATNIIANAGLASMCGIILDSNISEMLPPTIIAVMTYANKENVRYRRILAYFLYGIKISVPTIIPVKHNAMTKTGTGGTISCVAAAIAPMSTPMLIVFAIKSKVVRGTSVLFE